MIAIIMMIMIMTSNEFLCKSVNIFGYVYYDKICHGDYDDDDNNEGGEKDDDESNIGNDDDDDDDEHEDDNKDNNDNEDG